MNNPDLYWKQSKRVGIIPMLGMVSSVFIGAIFLYKGFYLTGVVSNIMYFIGAILTVPSLILLLIQVEFEIFKDQKKITKYLYFGIKRFGYKKDIQLDSSINLYILKKGVIWVGEVYNLMISTQNFKLVALDSSPDYQKVKSLAGGISNLLGAKVIDDSRS